MALPEALKVVRLVCADVLIEVVLLGKYVVIVPKELGTVELSDDFVGAFVTEFPIVTAEVVIDDEEDLICSDSLKAWECVKVSVVTGAVIIVAATDDDTSSNFIVLLVDKKVKGVVDAVSGV